MKESKEVVGVIVWGKMKWIETLPLYPLHTYLKSQKSTGVSWCFCYYIHFFYNIFFFWIRSKRGKKNFFHAFHFHWLFFWSPSSFLSNSFQSISSFFSFFISCMMEGKASLYLSALHTSAFKKDSLGYFMHIYIKNFFFHRTHRQTTFQWLQSLNLFVI